MHPDLSPHLHTPECNELINNFKDCNKNHPLLKFTGYCTPYDDLMLKCLKKERLARRAANAAKALQKNQEVRERMKTIPDELL